MQPTVVMRFMTRGGATVVVTAYGADHTWKCCGCHDCQGPLAKSTARDRANNHAASCWSMPPA